MTDTTLLRADLGAIRARLDGLVEQIRKDGDGGGAPAGTGPDASDVHVPAAMGEDAARRKKLAERVKALADRVDKARWPAGTPGAKGGQFAPNTVAGGPSHVPGLAGKTFHEAGWDGSGKWSKAPAKPPAGSKPHPQVNDKGQPVTINYPSKPSAPDTWTDPTKTATFVPGGDVPKALNGVAFRPWTPPADDGAWATVSGQNPKISEDAFEPVKGKSVGTGVIVVEPDGRVWLTKPTNEFGGYQHTFPKGTMEPNLPMQANAIKEAYEETGLKVEITGVFGDFERTTSKARYYIARRVGGTPKDMGWESQALRLAPMHQLKNLLNMPVDKGIVDEIKAEIEISGRLHKAQSLAWRAKVLLAKAAGAIKPGGKLGQQPRWPAGSSLGGQWKAYDSAGLTLPPKIGSASNPLPGKKAQALYAAAASGDAKALADYIAANQGKADAYTAAGGKLNSQGKWAAGVHQYAVELHGQVTMQPKMEAAAAKLAGPEKISGWKKVGGKPGGSNPGAIYDVGQGDAWLVKGNKQLETGAVTKEVSDDRAKNEVLASHLLKAAGAGTVDMKLVDLGGQYGGGLGVAGKMISGHSSLNPGNAAHLEAVQKDFAVQAWLGNYDALGMGLDNTVIKDGTAVNIDPGGALLFRAQGLPKASFGQKADEWDTMRTTTSEQKAVYGKMTASQLQESAKALQQIDDATIKALVDAHGPGDAAAKAKLADTLIARRDDILTRAGLKDGAAPAGPATPKTVQANNGDALAAAGQAKLQAKAALQAAAEAKGVAVSESKVHGLLYAGNKGGMAKTYANKAQAHVAAAKLIGAGVQAEVVGTHPPYLITITGVTGGAPPAAATSAPPAAPAPAASLIEKPAFSTGLKSDDYYAGIANKLQAAAAAGDMTAFKAIKGAGTTKSGAAMATWGGKTANSKKLVAYHDKLLADLDGKQQVQIAAKVQAAQEEISKPARVAQAQAVAEAKQQAAVALPNFEAAKAPAANSNAPSHNGKVDKIAALAAAGDVKGIISLNYGTNTYGKKQAQLANDALAAMGSELKVAVGQKSNEHPALTGGVPMPQAVAAAQTAKVEPPKPAAKPAKAVPKFKPENLNRPPDFTSPSFYNAATGKYGPPSSKSHVNEANTKAAADAYAAALTGNLDTLKNLSFEVLDKGTGAHTGQFKPYAQHPSQHVSAYHASLVGELDLQLNPLEMPRLGQTMVGATLADVSANLKPVAHGKAIAAIPKNKKAGSYIVLGKADPVLGGLPKDNDVVIGNDTWKSEAKAHYSAASDAAKSTFSTYLSTAGAKALNTALRDGNMTSMVHGKSVAQHVKDFEALLVDVPEGSTFVRRMGMKGYGQTPNSKDIQHLAQFLMTAEKGTVVQEPGFTSTSWTGGNKILGNNDIEWNFTAAKGAKVFPAWLGANVGEGEGLFPPNQRYMIVGAKKVGKTVVVDAVLLPHLPA